MNKRYSNDEIIQMSKDEVARDPLTFYESRIVNYKSKTSDSRELCTEVIAGFLTENRILDKIKEGAIRGQRKGDYIIDSHDGDTTGSKEKDSNRIEEITAKDMYGKYYDHIGRIVGYQIPSVDGSKNNIDLLSVNDDTSKIHIIELKRHYDEETRKTSKETMLKCLLESFTYYEKLDLGKLKNELQHKRLLRNEPDNYSFVISPLVFEKTQPYKEMKELVDEKREKLENLIDYMKTFVAVEPYYLVIQGREASDAECHDFYM